MSCPDYQQTVEDHRSILILVKPVGSNLTLKEFRKIFKRISCLKCVQIQDSSTQPGFQPRSVWLRYKEHYSLANNEWGDFQTHRKVLGLITVGKYVSDGDMENMFEHHKKFQAEYKSTLYDSRCLVVGTSCPTPSGGDNPLQPNGPDKSWVSQCLFFPTLETDNDQLEHELSEYISSVFWILESKRLDRSFEKLEKVPMLLAPFEKRDLVGIDTDTRPYKKRCLARMRKHLGDLSLQADMPAEALSLYALALDPLKSVGDLLWLGSTIEGQCAASALFLYPPVPPEVTKLQPSRTRQGGKTAPKSHPNGIEPVDLKSLGKNLLFPEEIPEKYKEAENNYSKYGHAAIVRMESSFKASKILALQENFLLASEFLMNVTSATFEQSEEDRVQQCYALARQYAELGFHRKAAFFTRAAAMHCLTNPNTDPDYQRCYYFLLETFEGYKLSLDPKDVPQDHMYGWPSIQIKILFSLINTARKMGNQALAVRHLTFLLHTLAPYMTNAEKQDYCSQLEAFTAKCEGGPVPLALENGTIIPPVNLTGLPKVRSFKPLNLAPHLRPVRLSSILRPVDTNNSPFIFSPINNKYPHNRLDANSNKLDFKWVQGDVCEVSLQVYNPMPFELKVSHMGLLADGLAFESFPASLSLPAESGPYPFSLGGTPLITGELQLLGYVTHVLGVKSNCLLKEIPTVKRTHYIVDVIPALPQLQVSTSLPKATTFSTLGNTSHVVISGSAVLYAGESQVCTITLTNEGKVPVERIDLNMHSKLDKENESKYFNWDKKALDAQLPIEPGQSATLSMQLYGAGDFIYPQAAELDGFSGSSNKSKLYRASSPMPTTPNRKIPEGLSSKTVEAVLQLYYTGGPGKEADYCRQCGVSLTVEVLPSVAITRWDVLPGEVGTHCYLVLDALNATRAEMELHYPPNKTILIEPAETCRIPVSVARCPISNSRCLESACQDHLVNQVQLSWALPSLDIFGEASVADISWTPTMLDVILLSPVNWKVAVNGQKATMDHDFSLNVGELIQLSISLENLSDSALHSLLVSMQTFQDHQNGHHNYRLETKRAIVGSDKAMIDSIEPESCHTHECGLLFFHTGLYKVTIQCNSGSNVWRYGPTLELTID